MTVQKLYDRITECQPESSPFLEVVMEQRQIKQLCCCRFCRDSLLQDGVEIIHQGLVVDIAVIPFDNIPFLVHQK